MLQKRYPTRLTVSTVFVMFHCWDIHSDEQATSRRPSVYTASWTLALQRETGWQDLVVEYSPLLTQMLYPGCVGTPSLALRLSTNGRTSRYVGNPCLSHVELIPLHRRPGWLEQRHGRRSKRDLMLHIQSEMTMRIVHVHVIPRRLRRPYMYTIFDM